MKSPEAESHPSPFLRRHDLDALRAIAMLLGIALHGALAYVTFPYWPVHDAARHRGFDLFIEAVHGFRMPLFFMISGFFAAMLWRKRGLASLLRHRARRILLPLLLLLLPLQLAGFGIVIAIHTHDRSQRDQSPVQESLWTAAKTNNLAMLQEQLQLVEDINAPDPIHDLSPLHWAALHNHREAAAALLDAGADINVTFKDGTTPLGHAAFLGRTELTALLLERGAEVNLINQYQATPLDSTKANWRIVEWAAGHWDLPVDQNAVRKGQRKSADLLRLHGGKHKHALAQETGSAKESPSNLLDRLSDAYLAFSNRPIFKTADFFGHLWFLWFLCLLIVPFLLYAMAADAIRWRGPPKWLFLSPALLFWLIPMTMLPQWFHGLRVPTFGPDTSTSLFPLPHTVILYGLYFFFGALYFDCDDRTGKLGRYWWISLPIALFLVFPLGHILTHDPEGEWLEGWIPLGLARPLSVLTQSLFAWLMIFGLMGLFRQVCARENALIRYVSDSSYWLYLAHIPVLFLLQAMVRPLDLPALAKFGIVCVSVTALLLLSYETAVRYTWLGTLLNGKRTRTGKGTSGPNSLKPT